MPFSHSAAALRGAFAFVAALRMLLLDFPTGMGAVPRPDLGRSADDHMTLLTPVHHLSTEYHVQYICRL